MKQWVFFAVSLATLNLGLSWELSRQPRGYELHLLDVGQGDAVLLRTPDQHTILVDGGTGEDILMELSGVLPLLSREIDLMVMTHPHADHMGGLIPVLERFEVKHVLMSAPDYASPVYRAFLAELEQSGVPFSLAQASQDFALGELQIDVIYPFEPFLGQEMENVNNASPVLRVQMGPKSVLLNGDAEQEVEAELLAAGLVPSADILKAGHHGSRTSNTPDFVAAVNPELLLISCGKDNSYGHPHEETLELAEDLGLEVRRTDLEGRVSLYW